MNTKKQIEKSTAEEFLRLYNQKFGSSFRIDKLSDNPDVLCQDADGNKLNLEITLTEDRDGDIKALLGKSNHRDLKYVKEYGMGPASSLYGNVYDQLRKTIEKKMKNDYGSRVALVIRSTSGVEWNWEWFEEDLKEQFKETKNPFDMGIWILDYGEIYKIF